MDLGTWTGANVDPALPYLLFATVLLAAVAVVAGALRRDHRALRRISTLLKLLAAVGAAVLVAQLTGALGAAPPADSALWSRLAGLDRLPLWVAALAYGPSVGVLVGLAYLGLAAVPLVPVAASPVLVVELAVLGWLSIYPSPLRHRWAGPVDALSAYALAWGTAGLTQLYARGERVSWGALAGQHDAVLSGALLAVAGLFAFGPDVYRRWFPESVLHGGPDALPGVEG